MDINILREAVTVLSFIAFLGIVWFAVHPGNGKRFEEAARLPLDDDGPAGEGPSDKPGFANAEHK